MDRVEFRGLSAFRAVALCRLFRSLVRRAASGFARWKLAHARLRDAAKLPQLVSPRDAVDFRRLPLRTRFGVSGRRRDETRIREEDHNGAGDGENVQARNDPAENDQEGAAWT